jgi:hypothetical protein
MSLACQLEMTFSGGFPGGVEGDGSADERWAADAARGAAGFGSAPAHDRGGRSACRRRGTQAAVPALPNHRAPPGRRSLPALESLRRRRSCAWCRVGICPNGSAAARHRRARDERSPPADQVAHALTASRSISGAGAPRRPSAPGGRPEPVPSARRRRRPRRIRRRRDCPPRLLARAGVRSQRARVRGASCRPYCTAGALPRDYLLSAGISIGAQLLRPDIRQSSRRLSSRSACTR